MSTLSELTSRRVFVGIVLVSVALLGLVIWPFATALFLAAVLAGALSPFQERLSGWLRGNRNVAAALLIVAVVLLLVVPVAGVAAFIVREAAQGYRFVAETVRSEGMSGLLEQLPDGLENLARQF